MVQRWAHIVCFLNFVVLLVGHSATEPDGEKERELFVQLREERKARNLADLRVSTAEKARAKTERQLDELRASFAELYLENQELRRDNEALRLQAGHLVVNQKAAGSEEAEVLDRRLQRMQRQRRQVEQRLRELEVQLQTLFDLENADDAVRTLVKNRFTHVHDALGEMAKAANPAQTGLATVTRQAAVLEVHPDLQLLILDKGSEHGITAGSRWRISANRDRQLDAQVVSVRPRISAAFILAGKADAAAPGQTAKQQFSKPKSPKPKQP